MSKIAKSETNNAVVVQLGDVRAHPNADRLKLATVLGTQVIVGLESREGDIVVYFDSNLKVGHEYLHANNLYSNPEQNANTRKKGYFPKSGRVKAQKLRGELSNGFVADYETLNAVDGIEEEDLLGLNLGDEFDSINWIRICAKYIVPRKDPGAGGANKLHARHKMVSEVFHRHWDTKQLMRCIASANPICLGYLEEKVHGTSGRSANVECFVDRSSYTGGLFKFVYKCIRPLLTKKAKKSVGHKLLVDLPYRDFVSWIPGLLKKDWRVVSGTRRVDSIRNHIAPVREAIDAKIAPHLRKGEEVYYEIYGYDHNGTLIQSTGGHAFKYDCRPGEWKAMLYRVTITTPDGFVVDLPRHMVYKRAEELGIEKSRLVKTINFGRGATRDPVFTRLIEAEVVGHEAGVSLLDAATMREGVVLWFQDPTAPTGWTCLKHKSEEFLLLESKARDNDCGDIEDEL